MIEELNLAHSEKLLQASRTKSFLGREFLTWLWCFIDGNAGSSMSILIKEQKKPITITLWIDDRIVLDSNSGVGHQHVMRGGDPAHSPEAGIALATGKTVRELKLGLNIDGVGDFSTNLNSSDLNPRSIQLPGDDDLGDAEENSFLPAHQRIKQITLLLSVIDHLFATFLADRISDDWSKGAQNDIKEWIQSKSSNLTSSIRQFAN